MFSSAPDNDEAWGTEEGHAAEGAAEDFALSSPEPITLEVEEGEDVDAVCSLDFILNRLALTNLW